jgi:chromate transporter
MARDGTSRTAGWFRLAARRRNAVAANAAAPDLTTPQAAGTAREVFATFLRLGLTSFGGPVAHLGYFRREIVERRGWLSEAAYGELVGLCQFLPGPASSQVGFGVGLLRAGALGGLAAWAGFTLPSALIMVAFAWFEGELAGPIGAGILHGLKLVAVPVVVQAIAAMARTLTPDLRRRLIAVLIAVLAGLFSAAWTQLAAIALGAVLGLLFCPASGERAEGLAGSLPARWLSAASLLAFVVLLALSLFLGQDGARTLTALAATFFRAGALVFGGGHVVLPLLRTSMVPHWIDLQTFLAGYGAAQAVPGPLFTFATFLGSRIAGLGGACVATIAIFLPGCLLVTGILPFERAARTRPTVQKALAGINAAVVGILIAALVTTLIPTAILGPADIAVALAGLVLLQVLRLAPLALVMLTILATAGLAWTGLSGVHP